MARIPLELVGLGGRGADEVVLRADVGDLGVEPHDLPGAIPLDASLFNHATVGAVLRGHLEGAVRPGAIDDEVGADVRALRVSGEVTRVRGGGDGQVIAGFDVHAARDPTEVFGHEGHAGGTAIAIPVALDMDVNRLPRHEDRGDLALQTAVVIRHRDERLGGRFEDGHVAIVVEVESGVASGQVAGGEAVLSRGVHVEQIPRGGHGGNQVERGSLRVDGHRKGVIAAASDGTSGQGEEGGIEMVAVPQHGPVIADLIRAAEGKAIGPGVVEPHRQAAGGNADVQTFHIAGVQRVPIGIEHSEGGFLREGVRDDVDFQAVQVLPDEHGVEKGGGAAVRIIHREAHGVQSGLVPDHGGGRFARGAR